MRITIDTKEDSHEEIRRAIKMLSHLVGEHPVSNSPDIFEDGGPSLPSPQPEEPAPNAFANMFGDDPKPVEQAEESEDTTIEEKEDAPEVMEYE